MHLEAFAYFLASTIISIGLAYKDEIREWNKRIRYQPKHRK